jgi:predicted TIM-barrel fold metal-dependent hydrolase
MYLPFGCVHPGDRNLGGIIEEALDVFAFRGLKIHCMVAGVKADDPSCTPIYRELEKRGRMLVIHAGTAPLPSPWLGLDSLERVLEAHPGMIVQLAHLGHFEMDRAARLLETYPGLYLDTAWAMGNSYMKVDPGAVRDLITGFPDRILYGSDFPIIPEDPLIGVEKLIGFNLPGGVLGKVLAGNAEKIMAGLSGGLLSKSAFCQA